MGLLDTFLSFVWPGFESEADQQRSQALVKDRTCLACRFFNPEGKISENPVPDENGYFYVQVGKVCINKTICRNDTNLPKEVNSVFYYPHQHYTRSLCDYFEAGKYDKYSGYERNGY